MLFANAELRRSKVRFGMLTIGTGLLVFVLLFMQALLTSVLDGWAGAISHQSAPVLVLTRDAHRAVIASSLTYDKFQDVGEVPAVGNASELGFLALSFRRPDARERTAATIIGYRPGQAGTPTGLSAGRLPEAPGEVVASIEDARSDYAVGDTVVIEPGEVSLQVVGLTEKSRMNISPTFWAPWPTYEELFKIVLPGTQFAWPSVAAVTPAPGVEPDQLIDELNTALPDMEALTTSEAVQSAPGREGVEQAFWMVIGLGYVVVAVVVGFFFLTLTLHKERSIVLVRAIGARAGYVIGSLLRQLVVVMVLGIGIGVGLLFAAEEAMSQVIVISTEPAVMLRTAVPVVAVGLLAIIPPVWRVLRTDPQAAISRPSFGGAVG